MYGRQPEYVYHVIYVFATALAYGVPKFSPLGVLHFLSYLTTDTSLQGLESRAPPRTQPPHRPSQSSGNHTKTS